jgi:hypothetical protein
MAAFSPQFSSLAGHRIDKTALREAGVAHFITRSPQIRARRAHLSDYEGSPVIHDRSLIFAAL